MAMLPIEAGTHCVGGSIDDQAAPLSRRSRAKRRIHTEQFCSRNLIVTPDVSLHAQRARHASAPATRRAARAAGERSAAVQGSGRAAAAGSAGRPADARSDAAGCGPATFLRRAAAKVAASMGWSASISAPICRMALLAVSITARCAGRMAACRRCGLHGSHQPCLQRANGAS